MFHSTRRKVISAAAALVFMFGMIGAATLPNGGASAGPEIVGDPNGAGSRLLISEGQSVQRIVYFETANYTMANTTPVPSGAQCGVGTLHKAEIRVNGTLTGTNPTLAFKWQNSIDGGETWTDVGTWTTYNATTTPATQNQVVSDVSNATTAVAYGDCWRAVYTFGGTGTVTANMSIKGVEK